MVPPDETDSSDGDPRLDLVRDLFGDRYQIDGRLPWGGLAIVYAAQEPGRDVAVAVLPLDCGGAPEIEDAFEIWSAGLEEFHHAGHVPVTDSGVQHGVPYLELERTKGRTLWEFVAEAKLAPLEALRLAVDVAKVVDAAHARDLVHWDLTPSNVLVDGVGEAARVHVLGFGVAPLLFSTKDDKSTGPTGKGSGPKARRFLAPERLANAEGGMRADQYSLGALVYFLLRGEPPPEGKRPRLDELGGLETVIARAMKTDPQARFSDVSTLRQALEAVLVGARRKLREPSGVVQNLAETLEPGRSVPPPEPQTKPRSRAPLVTLIVACLALTGAALWWATRARAPEAPSPPATNVPVAAASSPSPGPSQGAGAAPTEAANEVQPSTGDAPDADAAPSEAEAGGAPLNQPLPELLAAALRRVETGSPFAEADLGPLYGYTTAHADESRAHAVMGHVFVSMHWSSAAADAYARAARIDPGTWTNAAVLEDLLVLARNRDPLLEKTWPVLRNRYGRAALPAVDAAITAGGPPAERARLRRLRARLDRLPPG